LHMTKNRALIKITNLTQNKWAWFNKKTTFSTSLLLIKLLFYSVI
jgi:hypothetical protein